jgi:hypothetical protein
VDKEARNLEKAIRYGETAPAIWSIHNGTTGCVYAQVGIPQVGDIEIQVYHHEGNGRFLLTIPEFNWCSYVGDFEVFDTSSPGNENDVFKGYRGYYLTMGDVEIVIPELRPYVKEMKFIFSLLLSLLYKETTNELYRNTGTRCTIEEHIRYCKRTLESWHVYLAEE